MERDGDWKELEKTATFVLQSGPLALHKMFEIQRGSSLTTMYYVAL
jgi:hypothetical protein